MPALQTTLRHAAHRTWALLVACAIAASLAGCDRGRHVSTRGTARADDLCPEPAAAVASGATDGGGACPRCSARDALGLCRDSFYAHAVRCGDGDASCEAAGGHCGAGFCVLRDDDGDGLDDDFEREIAERNLPAIYAHPDERCGAPRGVVYRARRHPDRPARVAITYVVLYDRDCGSWNGHLADNEAFGITVDLDARPGAPATVALISDAHRHTICDSLSTCQTAPGTSACAPTGSDRTAVYSSRAKHANYLFPEVCAGNCLDDCAAGPVDPAPLLVDVGEPEAPLVHDLSSDATMMISTAGGWHAPLLHFDPWMAGLFGDAGHVREQLEKLLAPVGL